MNPTETTTAMDVDAVFRHFAEKTPVPPEVAERVREEAAKVTEEIYRTHGFIDDETFQKIVDEDE